MRKRRLFMLLLASIVSATVVHAQTVGTRFAIGDVTYQITRQNLETHDNEVGIYRIGGTGVVTIPALVTNQQNKEIYKVATVIPWIDSQVGDSVTEFILPEGLTSIPDGCFRQTGKFTKVTIPSTCTTIGTQCFVSNSNLTTFEVNGGNPSYKAEDGVLFTKDGAELAIFPSGKSGDYTIPSGVTKVRPYAFTQATKVGTLTIPATVTDMTFDGGPSIQTSATQIKVAEGNPNFSDIDGVLCNKDKTILYSYPARRTDDTKDANYKVPGGITEIAPSAFYVSSIRSIDLNEVKTIGKSAFEFSYSLRTINIGKNVETIGEAAFVGCGQLATITVDADNDNYKAEDNVLFSKDGTHLMMAATLKAGSYNVPSTVTEIDGHAFYESRITSVTIPASVKTIGGDAFGYSKLASLTFDAGSQVDSIGQRAFAHCDSLTSVVIPASVRTIGGNAFSDMKKLQTVTIEDGSQLTTLRGSTFANNPELTTLAFEGTTLLTTIPDNMVANDPKLQSFVVPSSVTAINGNAFLNTPSMKSVTFQTPASITAIRTNAFAYSGIEHIDLPPTVTSIEQQAFDNCTGLQTVNIPASVTSIATGVFNMCENLTAINVDGSNPNYASLDGMLCNKDKTTLVVFPAGKGDTRYTLIPYFETVAPYAFYGSKKITNIIFPQTVTSIGTRAIALCENLKSMSFMGVDNVPALTAGILYESSKPEDITIYVRKAWFENTANDATIQNYDNVFKEVHPSFVPTTGYDRGTEFFPTSDEHVGVISFYTERTSVIINPTATEEAYTDRFGHSRAEKDYTVSSILDFAYGQTDTVRAITVLADIGYVGLNAFKGSAVEQVFFVGDTPAELGSVSYEMPGSYAFNENQNIYVKESKVADYQAAWEVDGHTLNITHKIPVTTNQYGGTMCYPFDVRFPQGLGADDIKPYMPLNYEAAYDATNPIVRAYSVDDYYVPAYVGVFFRSKSKASVASYCQMDEAQAHSTATIAGMGYDAAGYRMLGMVEDSLTVNEAGYNRYAFSKSSGKLVLLKDGALVPYFKAVLRMPDSAGSPAKAFSLRFSDDEGTVTGIDGVADRSTVEDAAAPVYDLNGVKVSQPRRGIYVRNGKKIVIK